MDDITASRRRRVDLMLSALLPFPILASSLPPFLPLSPRCGIARGVGRRWCSVAARPGEAVEAGRGAVRGT